MEERSISIDDLPNGWVKCNLIDCGDIVSGGTPSTKIAEYWGNEVSWITPADLSGYENKHISKGQKSITRQGLLKSSAKLMPKGSVLFSTRAPIGYVVIASNDICTNQGFKSIVPNNLIYNEFLYHFFKSAKQLAEKHASGTTFKELSLKAFSQIPIDVPPFREQHRIVAKIEELFSELDKGVEALKTAQQQLKVYRQAVLKWAFEGKLTEKWRKQQKNLPTASQLLEQIKTEREKVTNVNGQKLKSITPLTQAELTELPVLPDGWKWMKAGQLYNFVTSGSRGWAQYYSESGAIFIRITNLDFDSVKLDLAPSKLQYVMPPEGAEGLRTRVTEGDLLFSITGYLGMFAIAPKLKEAYINQHIALCRPVDGFNKLYLGFWAISKTGGNHYLNQMQKGATKAGLGLDDIQNLIVPFCALGEQNQIVQEIETRLSVANKLEETITQSLQQAEALRQSILKKAFAGQLVPQDPHDEPADRLLTRIRAAKAAQTPENGTVRRRGAGRKAASSLSAAVGKP